MANPAPGTEPVEQVNEDNVLCDIEHPVLFQAVLTRLASTCNSEERDNIGEKVAHLSPRSLIVVLAAGEFDIIHVNASRLEWMLRGPNPYILKHPTMMHEVRGLDLCGLDIFPPLQYFTSLRNLYWSSQSSQPDDVFSLVRQHVTGLQDLEVIMSRLTAPMLNDIAQMTNLKSLSLNAADVVVIPPLGNLRGLKHLAIDDWNEERNQVLIFPSTLEGLTQLESLELETAISVPLAKALPTILPLLWSLRICRKRLSKNVVALLESHYEDKEEFELDIW